MTSRRFEGPEEVLAFIRELAQELGRAPMRAEAERAGLPRRVVARFFDDWCAAVQAAGLKPLGKQRARWTRERVLEVLRQHAARAGRPLAPADLDGACGRPDFPSDATLRVLFGGRRRALEAAGVAAPSPARKELLRDLEAFLIEQASSLPEDARFLTEKEAASLVHQFALAHGVEGDRWRAAARKILASLGVAVLAGKTFSLPRVRAVCDWLRGRSVNGVCPSREDLAGAMGEKGWQALCLAVRAGSLRQAAREAGVYPWALAMRLRSGARRAARLFLCGQVRGQVCAEKKRERKRSPSPAGLLVARRNRYGVPFVLVQRTAKGKTIDSLAQAAGVSPEVVRALEEGHPVPRKVAAGIARALGRTSGSLFVRAG